jgi:hypothetical protein
MCDGSENSLRSLFNRTLPAMWLALLLHNQHKFGDGDGGGKPIIDVDAALQRNLRDGYDYEDLIALLRHGADVMKPTSDTGETQLFLAYRGGCSQAVIVKMLQSSAATAAHANAVEPLVIDPCTPSSPQPSAGRA